MPQPIRVYETQPIRRIQFWRSFWQGVGFVVGSVLVVLGFYGLAFTCFALFGD